MCQYKDNNNSVQYSSSIRHGTHASCASVSMAEEFTEPAMSLMTLDLYDLTYSSEITNEYNGWKCSSSSHTIAWVRAIGLLAHGLFSFSWSGHSLAIYSAGFKIDKLLMRRSGASISYKCIHWELIYILFTMTDLRSHFFWYKSSPRRQLAVKKRSNPHKLFSTVRSLVSALLTVNLYRAGNLYLFTRFDWCAIQCHSPNM
jgi:hypothetical protein